MTDVLRQSTLDGSAPPPNAHDFLYHFDQGEGVMIATCPNCRLRLHMATLESEHYDVPPCIPQASLLVGGE